METREQMTPAKCINECAFWLEGLTDGTCQSKEEVMAILAKAISSLQAAYTRILFD